MKDFLSKIFKELTAKSTEKADKRSKTTILVLLLTLIVAFVCIAGRFAYLQLIKGDELSKLAYKQQNSGRALTPTRGTIYDTNGNILAMSIDASKISVNPNIIRKVYDDREKLEKKWDDIATYLSSKLDVKYDDVMTALKSESYYKLIKSKVSKETGNEISAWVKENKITGVYVDSDYIRYYPNNSLACHLLGFTGTDDQGLVCGIEVAFDSELAGTQGRIITEVDKSGNELPFDAEKRIEAVDGYNVVTTVDVNIQLIIENIMKDAVEEYGVLEGASCVVMDPDTGDVLGMCSYPDFNLNSPYDYPANTNPEIAETEWKGRSEDGVAYLNATVWRNKAISDTYEPGSTFKAFVASMLLEEGVVKTTDEVEDSPLELAGWTIRCWYDNEETAEEENHGTETFEYAVINSCNPVFAKFALKLGIEKFYKYVDSFGFTSKTGIKLSGETESILHTNPTEIDVAVSAFGQRFQVSAIQICSAYCSIANGGKLVTPRTVKYLTDSEGNVVQSYDVQEVRQVLSKETCNTMLEILRKVVDEGTGSNAYVAGYRIAGKTGTSETTETKTTGRYVVSFSGIAPADDPKIVVLVMLDHPTVGSISGGAIAAPVAAKVIEQVLSYMGEEKKYTADDMKKLTSEYYVPECKGFTVQEGLAKLGNTFEGRVAGGDGSLDQVVVAQFPDIHSAVSLGSIVYLYTDADQPRETTIVPDVMGMTLNEVYETMHAANLNIFVKNPGTVVYQSIKPGTEVEVGTTVDVKLLNYDIEEAGEM